MRCSAPERECLRDLLLAGMLHLIVLYFQRMEFWRWCMELEDLLYLQVGDLLLTFPSFESVSRVSGIDDHSWLTQEFQLLVAQFCGKQHCRSYSHHVQMNFGLLAEYFGRIQ